jgi:hypothetical protein
MFGIEEKEVENRVSAHPAQGIAWPPLAETPDYGVGHLLKTQAILSLPGGVVKIVPEKFTLKL